MRVFARGAVCVAVALAAIAHPADGSGSSVAAGPGASTSGFVDSAGTLQVRPSSGAPGTRIVVTGEGCLQVAGATTSAAVGLGAPGIEDVAGASVWSDGGHSQPAYSPGGDRPASVFPADVMALRLDGSWSAPLWVPYGTPPGDYVIRAKCVAHPYDGDPETPPLESVRWYEPQKFVVTAWPAIPPTFTPAPLPSGLLVDGVGTRYPWGWQTVPLAGGPGWWSGRDVAQGVAFAAEAIADYQYGGGVVVDAFGGLHRFNEPAFRAGVTSPSRGWSWPGWDIARGVAMDRIARTGYQPQPPSQVEQPHDAAGLVLDGWGGLHPFTLGPSVAPPVVTPGTGPYWPGWDVARDLAILPGGGGGYVLDAWGGLHPFGLDGKAGPPKPAWQAYWKGWDVARGVVFVDDRSGYVFDAWGAAHPFSVDGAYQPGKPPTPYWPGRDVIRGATLVHAKQFWE
jgi:hypothetical protein